MTKIANAPAGFWIRLLTKVLDMLLVIVISIAILFGLLTRINGQYHFQADYGYYLWTVITCILLLISFILIPYLTKGKTLFMFVTRIKIVPEKGSLLKALIKREALFALAWVGMLILAMAVINHTLVNRFALKNQKDIDYSNIDKLRIGIVSTVGTLIMVLQLISVVGIFTKSDKKGFHDRASNSVTVWINKYIEEPTEKYVKQIQPRPVKDEIVEWITK